VFGDGYLRAVENERLGSEQQLAQVLS
jgi:hypothetical protein